jgi:hypothetical protein
MMHLLTCCSLLLLPASTVFAGFTGPVISVLDGDTLEVLLFLRGNPISRVKAGSGVCPHHDAGIDCV